MPYRGSILYREHFVFKAPRDEDQSIWRYMDFTKFVSLLDKSALFFARSDKLKDEFEGSYPTVTVIKRESQFKKIFEDFNVEPDSSSTVDKLCQWLKQIRSYVAINCWNVSNQESAALWKLYLKSNEGIAIKSNYRRLKSSFNAAEDDIYIGMVRYIDYSKQSIPDTNILRPFVTKRRSFEHEHELRALLYNRPSTSRGSHGELFMGRPFFDNGKYVPINLHELIDKIYVAPTCPDWLKELVESLLKLYSIDVQVVRSSLDEPPVY